MKYLRQVTKMKYFTLSTKIVLLPAIANEYKGDAEANNTTRDMKQ